MTIVKTNLDNGVAGDLPDDPFARRANPGRQSVGQIHPLVRLQGAEHRDALDERLVHLPLLEGGLQQDASECLAVHGPEGAVGHRLDRGGPRHVVQQRQLAETAAVLVGVYVFRVLAGFGYEGVVYAAGKLTMKAGAIYLLNRKTFTHRPSVYISNLLLDNVKIVSVVPLSDDGLPVLDLPLEHGVQHVLHLLLVQRAEQQDVTDRLRQPGPLLVRLRIH